MVDNKKRLRSRSNLSLITLLKRRKMTLERYVKDFGITSYEALVLQCERMGVTPPDYIDTLVLFGVIPTVNDPSDGIVVLNEPRIIDDRGDVIDDRSSDAERTGEVFIVTDERDLDVALNNSTGEHAWPIKRKKARTRDTQD